MSQSYSVTVWLSQSFTMFDRTGFVLLMKFHFICHKRAVILIVLWYHVYKSKSIEIYHTDGFMTYTKHNVQSLIVNAKAFSIIKVSTLFNGALLLPLKIVVNKYPINTAFGNALNTLLKASLKVWKKCIEVCHKWGFLGYVKQTAQSYITRLDYLQRNWNYISESKMSK